MNEQEIITKAKGHIRLGNYAKARILLNEVSTNSVAAKLLLRLDKFEAKRRARLGQGGGEVVIPKQESHSIPRPALFIILASMSLWASVYVFGVATSQYSQNLLLALLTVSIIFALILLLYYLFWRFYWWMLAIFWFLSACFLMISLATGLRTIPFV